MQFLQWLCRSLPLYSKVMTKKLPPEKETHNDHQKEYIIQ